MKKVLKPNLKDVLVVGNVTFRSCYDDRLTENDLELARLELGETDEKKKVGLLKLKEALIRDKDFNYRLDDEYLLRFLRYRKYDDGKAYESLRNLYTFRKDRPDLFYIPSNLEFFLRTDLVKCLPYRTEDGCNIIWIDSDKWKLHEMSIWDCLTLAVTIADVLSADPSCQINGLVGIWDLGGLTASHLSASVSLSTLSLFSKCMQAIYPWRIKRAFGVNCNVLIRGVYNTFSCFMQKKVADRVTLLGSDFSEIHQYLNPRILPKKYGGCIESSQCSIAQHILDNLSYIKYERCFGPNSKS